MEFLRTIKQMIFSVLKMARSSVLGQEELIRKIPLVLIIFNYLYRISGPKGIVLVNVSNNKMLVPAQASGLVLAGCWEKQETEIFKQMINPNMVVLDIGAHIGYYALIASKLVGDNGKVYAFEPEPDNFSLLEKNIKLNNFHNVIAVNKAVSNSTGSAKLFLQTSALHSLIQSEGNSKSIGVETVALDEFFSENQKIDLIKMDAEGSEYLILQGMERLLKNNRKISIITEFFPSLLSKYTDPDKYLEELYKNNFEVFEISSGKMKVFSKDSWKNKNQQSFNLLCQRK